VSDPLDHLDDAARAGRAWVLPSNPEVTAPPGSAIEAFERIAWGVAWERPGLSAREKRLITLAVLGIQGTDRTLGLHLRGALDSGDVTPEDLDAFLFHFGIYAGFPRGSAFASTLARVLAEKAEADASP
jgi:alkylhydroperoxidase/carboxymuconolactone decarboxylase family protein YurZ